MPVVPVRDAVTVAVPARVVDAVAAVRDAIAVGVPTARLVVRGGAVGHVSPVADADVLQVRRW